MVHRVLGRILLALAFASAIISCSRGNSPQQTAAESSATGMLLESRKLATVPSALTRMIKGQAKQVSHDPMVEFAKSGRGVAYIEPVSNRFRVVLNGQPGIPHYAVGDLSVSDDGKRVIYVAHLSDSLRRVVVDHVEGPLYAEIGTPHFTPDGKHFVYTVTKEKKTYLVIDHKVISEFDVAQDLLVSPDSRYVAFVKYPDSKEQRRFVISDFTLQDAVDFPSCGEMFLASEDRSRIAAVCSADGKRGISILDFTSRTVVESMKVPRDGNLYHLRFGPDNRSFVAAVIKDNVQRLLLHRDRVAEIPAGDELLSDPLVLADPERVGVIIGNATNARLYTAFHERQPKDKTYGFTSEFSASRDGRHYAYVAINAGGEERMRVVVDGNEGPIFDKVISPVFSPDGRYLVYRARQGGKRFLVVSDTKGAVVRQHRDYEMVFQPVFTDDGKSVVYGAQDGDALWWMVERL